MIATPAHLTLAQPVSVGDVSREWSRHAADYGLPALKVVLFMVVAWLVARWIASLVARSLTHARVEPTLTRVFARIARYAIILIAAFIALGIFGINTAGFLTVLGSIGLAAALAAGLAAGFALQSTLANIAAGLAIQITKPFEQGDTITIGAHTGTVDSTSLFATRIHTPDARSVIIPNAHLLSGPLENLSRGGQRMVSFTLHAASSAAIDVVRDTLVLAANGIRTDAPTARAVLEDADAARQRWRVTIQCPPDDADRLRERTLQACKEALDRTRLA